MASVGVAGRFTQTPSNSIALVEDSVILKCSINSTPNSIIWVHDVVDISSAGCVSSSDSFQTTNNNQSTDCFLIVQGNASDRLSGPYSCKDAGLYAQAVVIIIGT